MKRLLLAVATVAAITLIPTPAHADKPCHGYEIAELEGVCLTEDQYEYVLGLQADSERLVEVEALNAHLHGVNQRISADYHEVVDALWALRPKVEFWKDRAERRRYKVITLRREVRALERTIEKMGTFTC